MDAYALVRAVSSRHRGVGTAPVWVFAACCLVGWTVASAAQVTVVASADPSRVAVGDRITYTVTVEGAGDMLPPDFGDFDVLMGPATSTSIQWVNGRMSQSQSFTWVLRARKPGAFVIAPARVKVKGQEFQSNAVPVEVVGPGAASSPRQDDERLPAGAGQGRETPEVFITARADRDTAYRQEQVTVTYRLYLRVNVVGYEFLNIPQPAGFWMEEIPMPSRPVLQDVTVRGVNYKVAEIRKVALFPTRTGVLEVEPVAADVTVELPVRRSRSRDPFDWFFDDPFFSGMGRRETRTVRTEPLRLTVLDLPPAPADFHGDVGEFNLRVEYDRTELAQNDALNVKVTIAGVGYLKSVDAPRLNLPSGFEFFDPTATDNISISAGRMQGKRTFSYVVIPRIPGTFRLDGVTFTYFNPARRKYETAAAGAVVLNVSPAPSGALAAGEAVRSEVTLLDRDIRFIRGMDHPLVALATPPHKSAWFYATLAASPLLYLLGLGVEASLVRRRADPDLARRRSAPEVMKRALTEARRHLKAQRAASAVEVAARGFAEVLGAVLKVPAAGLTADQIRSGLKSRSAVDQLVAESLSLWQAADSVKFGGAPLTPENAATLLERFRAVSAELLKLK